MVQEPPDREPLSKEYEQLRPNYERLEDSLKRDLKMSIDQAGIRVLSIESRLKEFDSFWGKVQHKHYENPLHDMPDLCGLRIICYYPADVEPVSQVIEDSLDVIEFVNKAVSQKPDEFGYLSRHFIVTPNEDWLRTPSYQGLDGLKAEIQVRTIFQHAWAELSHELIYKKKKQVPRESQRRVFQLSAILEILDEQFDDLHQRKALSIRRVSEEAEQLGRFDLSQELNIDTLQAFLDFYFPDRDRFPHLTSDLFDDLVEYDVSMPQLAEGIERVRDSLPALDHDMHRGMSSAKLSQLGVIQAILELTNDDVYRASPGRVVWSGVINYWRRKLSEDNQG